MDFPLARSATGLPCSAEMTRSVRSALYAGSVVYPWQRIRKPRHSLPEEPRSIFRLSSADDAYEHLHILTLRPSLGPLHLMLADTPLPRSFGAALASVGTFSKGSRTVRCLPALPCRLTDGTHGLIEILLSRQSFSAALQVALRIADHPPKLGCGFPRPACGPFPGCRRPAWVREHDRMAC